jgi:hypothetical protein
LFYVISHAFSNRAEYLEEVRRARNREHNFPLDIAQKRGKTTAMPENPEEPVGAGPPPVAPPRTPHEAWARTTLWIGCALIFMVGALSVFRSCRSLPGEAATRTASFLTNAANALVSVAAAFNQGSFTTSFLSYATTIRGNQYLQFATLKQTEIFTHTDEATTGFGYIPLPEIVVEARAPVEYTYHLDLNGKWEFVFKDNVVYVLAPDIKFNKPAVDASEIQYEIRKGSVLRGSETARENLKQSITFLAQRRARENISLVRETGRRKTAEFVENWLVKSFGDGRQYPVKVFFAKEKLPAGIFTGQPGHFPASEGRVVVPAD